MSSSFTFIRTTLIFTILTGILLALCWPPLPFGFIILIAFVPLLWLEARIISSNNKKRFYFFSVFFAMLIWHLTSLRWLVAMGPKNAIIVSIINSILIASFLMIPHFLKRIGRNKLGHFAFVCFWVSLELLHVNWELSFPILSLGNSLGMFPFLIQWYEWTGVMGGSIWILTLNILLFQILKKGKLVKTKGIFANNELKFFGIVFTIPFLCSLFLFFTYQETGKSVEVVSIHPNVNCHNEKYTWTEEQLLSRYLKCTFEQISHETDYVIWPENAITNTQWLSNTQNFSGFNIIKNSLKNYPNTKLITGGISYDLYPHKTNETSLPPNVSLSEKLNQAYYTYNAAFQIETGQPSIPMRSKIQLVPFEESLPYAEWLGFIRKISGSLGGFIFSSSKKNNHVFRSNDGTKVTPLICYESAFGASTAEYVQDGAQILFVLLNEGWYKHQQGAKQFLYMSAIRAIETRRSIARSSNDGISAFINQRGQILQQVDDYKPSAIKQSLKLNSKKSLYVYLKDFLAKICAICAISIGFFSLSLIQVKNK